MSFHERVGAARPNYLSAAWKIIGSTITAISVVSLIQRIHATRLASPMSDVIASYRRAIHPVANFCTHWINALLGHLPLKVQLPVWYHDWLALSAIGSTLLLRALAQNQTVFLSALRRPVLFAKSAASFAIIGVLYSITLLGLLGLAMALVGMTYKSADKKVKDSTLVAAGDWGWATLFVVLAFYVINHALQMTPLISALGLNFLPPPALTAHEAN